MNTLSFATNMTKQLDKAIVMKPVTGFLADNGLKAKFVGAKTVMIPELEISGLGDYDRDSGFVQGTITVTNRPVVLSMDRGRSFQLDREDNDETGIADLAGQIMGEFVRTKVVPEVDAYCLSKLARYAMDNNQTITGTPASQAYKMFTEAVSKSQSVVGYDEDLVAFVDGTFWTALQTTSEMSRLLTVTNFKKGDVDFEVKSINGIPILPVPDSRMKTEYHFLSGSAGEESGGFVPTATAKKIGLLLMPKRAASLVKKTDQVRTFEPARNLNADAWKFDYRLYYDLFIRNSLAGGIYVYTY